MKNVLFWIIAMTLSLPVIAQSQPPQAFNYQGIARDISGNPLVNKNISLRLSILQGALPGSPVYQETHNVTTNKLGIFAIEVGHGSIEFGLLDNVQWGIADHYIQVELDPDGGTNYSLLGESQLLSVPYALYAGNAASGEAFWQPNANGIHYNEGNVGIGTDNPTAKLSIHGNDPVLNDRIYIDLNNESTSNRSLVWVNLSAGEPNSATSLQHFAETYDFDGDKYSDFGILASSGRGIILRADDPSGVIKFFAGGSIQSSPERMRINELGNVGIGTQNPAYKLSIEGLDDTGDARNYLHLNNQSTSNRSFVWMSLTAGEPNSTTSLQHFSETYDFDGDKYTDFGILASSGRGIILRADDPNGVIKFLAGGSIQSSPERMRINELGNVGIGTQTPSARVQVAGGDVYIQDIDNGVIMKSPDGGCWRLTVNNDGTIKTSAITCPD
ncbi:MAG: hypothetical protein IPP25_05680 [Saprospiraceae bacterium]|nr:hypothetical protein [Candidatus Opimibacter skivensis]